MKTNTGIMVKPNERVITANWQMFLPLLAIELHSE